MPREAHSSEHASATCSEIHIQHWLALHHHANKSEVHILLDLLADSSWGQWDNGQSRFLLIPEEHCRDEKVRLAQGKENCFPGRKRPSQPEAGKWKI